MLFVISSFTKSPHNQKGSHLKNIKYVKEKRGIHFYRHFPNCNHTVTCPFALSPPTYTHNIDNTQLHTSSHMVGPENTQLHTLRTHFLLTLNYTHA